MARSIKRDSKCSHCDDNRADFFVTGTIAGRNEKRVPYRAYLCDDHLNILHEDGAIKISSQYPLAR